MHTTLTLTAIHNVTPAISLFYTVYYVASLSLIIVLNTLLLVSLRSTLSLDVLNGNELRSTGFLAVGR